MTTRKRDLTVSKRSQNRRILTTLLMQPSPKARGMERHKQIKEKTATNPKISRLQP